MACHRRNGCGPDFKYLNGKVPHSQPTEVAGSRLKIDMKHI